MKALLSGKRKKRSQLGFTLVELMIAIAVSAMIMVGSMQILSHMVVTTAQNRANTMAMLQVQYVGFWITEDVVQTRPDGVNLGDAQGFPLTIQWKQWNGVEHKVVYRVEGEKTWTLYREDLTQGGNATVGESLDPAGTRCEWVTGGNVTNVLKLDVTANVDGKVASRTYEINPRSK